MSRTDRQPQLHYTLLISPLNLCPTQLARVAEAAKGDLDEAQLSRQPHVRQSLAWRLNVITLFYCLV